MAYTVVGHMQARSGDAVPVDVVSGLPGTPEPGMDLTLSSDGGNVTWLVGDVGSTQRCPFVISPTVPGNPAAAGSGITLVMRGRFITQAAGGIYCPTTGPTTAAPHRFQFNQSKHEAYYFFTPRTSIDPIDWTTTERTLVARFNMLGANSVSIDVWADGGVGDTPDYIGSTLSSSENGDINGFRMDGRAGFSYHVRNIVVLDGEVTDAEGRSLANDLDAELGLGAGGPVLSNPTGAATGPTTAAGGVDTDTLSDGTVYRIASFLAAAPNETELKAGQMNGGTPADWSENQATTGANPQAWSATGLTTDTEYRFFSGQENAAIEFSNIIASPTFTPATIAALTNPTGVATSDTEAAGGFDTDTLSQGDAYAIVSTSATPPTWAQLQAGQESGGGAAPWSGNQPITGANPQALSATGLIADTAYYFHFGQLIGAGESNITQSAQFTTQSTPAVSLTFEPLTRNNGLLFASETGLSVRVYSDDGLTVEWWTDAGVTDALGVLTPIQDPAIVDQVWYKVDCWRDADGFRARTVRVQATL